MTAGSISVSGSRKMPLTGHFSPVDIFISVFLIADTTDPLHGDLVLVVVNSCRQTSVVPVFCFLVDFPELDAK